MIYLTELPKIAKRDIINTNKFSEHFKLTYKKIKEAEISKQLLVQNKVYYFHIILDNNNFRKYNG